MTALIEQLLHINIPTQDNRHLMVVKPGIHSIAPLMITAMMIVPNYVLHCSNQTCYTFDSSTYDDCHHDASSIQLFIRV